jgi:glutamyl-tRNA reductase
VAENTIAAEAKDFQRNLSREHIIPLIVTVRERLGELCRIELETFRRERGPFLHEQDHLLSELTSRITQALAMSLVRHVKEVPEKSEQQHMADAVHRLFHLEPEKELVSSK